VLRGALGTVLRQTSDYERIFAPKLAQGPSGLQDPPRPFVFRCGHLNGVRVKTGNDFWFDLHLFSRGHSIDLFAGAFRKLGEEGMGIERGRARLESVEALTVAEPLIPQNVSELEVQFITPTEMKSEHGGDEAQQIASFGTLLKRARDRVASLATLYGDGAPDLDFVGLGLRAEQIQTVQSDLKLIDVERKSTHTGLAHSIGGFIGHVQYAGPLTEFLPVLQAAVWTGVGRHTVWGQGEIRLSYGAGVKGG
jgi:hypothetical protein